MDAITVSNYQEFKQSVDKEMKAAAQSFVRIGYLLRQAKDNPSIMFGSGYETVTEFAKAEYGLDHTQVSRFIRINERFSEGGYSDHLLEQYEGMGSAKLTLMLSLPDSVASELTPEYSKADVQAIKEEVEAEAKVTDIERMIEGQGEGTIIEQVMHEVTKNNPQLYLELYKSKVEDLKEILAPNGEATYSTRVQGVGRVMLFAKDAPQLVYVREDRKEPVSYESIWLAIPRKSDNPKHSWELITGEPFPEEAKEVKTKVQKAEKPIKPLTDTASEGKTEEKVQLEEAKTAETRINPQSDSEFEEKQKNADLTNDENAKKTVSDTNFMNIPENEPGMAETRINPQSDANSETGDETDAYNDADTDGIADEQIEGQTSIEDHEEWMPELSVNDRKRVKTQYEDIKDSIKELDQKIGNMDNRGAIEVLKDIEWLAKNIRQTIEEALRE